MTGLIKEIGMALLGGWAIGVAFDAMKLTPPVPPLMGLVGAAGVLLGGFCYQLIVNLVLKQ